MKNNQSIIFIILLMFLLPQYSICITISKFTNQVESQQFYNNEKRLLNVIQMSFQSKSFHQNNKKTIVRDIFNQPNKNNQFGFDDKFGIKINGNIVSNQNFIRQLKQAGCWDKIQVGSNYDYTNITSTLNFNRLSQQLFDSISYQLLTFPNNFQQNQQIKIKLTNNNDFISPIGPFPNSVTNTNFEFKLSEALIKDPYNKLIKQTQYRYYDMKYGIGNINTQLPICIFSIGYKTFSKNKHIKYFKSLEQLNYTNFHIVYVDDNSPSHQIDGLIDFLQQRDSVIKQKIKIVHTLQNLGALANIYFYINKYCNSQDIVVNVDADDSLIGSQSLKILNSVYRNQNLWWVYSDFVQFDEQNNIRKGISKQLTVSTQNYRASQIWQVSHLRSFRKQLFQKIPIYHFIQYHLNPQTNNAYPKFYGSSADSFQIFSALELVGNDRYKHITDNLYLYSGPAYTWKDSNCYRLHQIIDQYKARIKNPLKRLNSFHDSISTVQNYENSNILQTLKQKNYQYKKCVKSSAQTP